MGGAEGKTFLFATSPPSRGLGHIENLHASFYHASLFSFFRFVTFDVVCGVDTSEGNGKYAWSPLTVLLRRMLLLAQPQGNGNGLINGFENEWGWACKQGHSL